MTAPTSVKQMGFIEKLVAERDVPFVIFQEMTRQLQVINTTANASAWINILLALPKQVTIDTVVTELASVLDASLISN